MASRSTKTIVKATEWVQVALLPEHVEDVKAKAVEVENAYLDLIELTKEGYNLTISHDEGAGGYTLRLAGITKGMAHNEGKLLYANSPKIELAVAALWVKHFLVSKRGTWKGVSNDELGFS